MSKKLLHLHLEDGFGNPSTLTCWHTNSGLSYSMYQGHGSSGMGYSLSNIQFYKYDRDGNINWQRNASLPIENLPNETLSQFKERVIDMLDKSTYDIVNIVNTNVSFAPE